MVFIWGARKRVVEDDITSSRSLKCPKCPYTGHMLLYREQRQAHVYWIPASRWKGKAGAMVCPRCGNSQFLKKREYKEVPKLGGSDSGVLLNDARMEISNDLELLERNSEAPLAAQTPASPSTIQPGSFCTECGNSVRPDAAFCGQCGFAVRIKCPSCQLVADPDQTFCSDCGSRLH